MLEINTEGKIRLGAKGNVVGTQMEWRVNESLPSNSSQPCYNPQVRNEFIPKLGQHFQTLDDCLTFYNIYGREGGFCTRMSSSKKDKNDEIIRKEFCCSKEGEKRIDPTNSGATVRKRGLTRSGCGAKLAVVKDRSDVGGYIVRTFVESHNHPLTSPSKVHLLPSHRGVTTSKKNLLEKLSKANVPPWQQMSILEIDSGGRQNVGFTMQDIYNAERDKRNDLKGHDATLLFEHFKDEKERNSSFTFAFLEEDGVMIHCFWADAVCRKAYRYFGDVLIFDTTYKTNRYDLVFAPIVVVNHHGRTTLLGCAFLSGEKTDAFEWFFIEFLKAMSGTPPKMIITYQDQAMKNAIATILPITFHRYCIWHILSKFSEKIGASTYKEHFDDFHSCIWNTESSEDFKVKWAEVMTKANLETNVWLREMFEIRERWVPVYSRHIFSANMTSSQRVEGAHAFFKKYVSHQNSMLDFVTRFNRGLSKIRHKELELDHKDIHEKPQTKTGRVMESQMSELYTLNVFNKFQSELIQSGMYLVKKTFKDVECTMYNAHRINEIGSNGRVLSLKSSSNFLRCSCQMFESGGIPCRHMLAYFTKKQIMELPIEYILQRWIKSSKTVRINDDFGEKDLSNVSVLMRRNSLFQMASKVIDGASLTKDGTNILKEILLSTQKSLEVMKLDGVNVVNNCSITHGTHGSQQSMKEPLNVRTKGCGTHKRLKRGKEKSIKKPRKCNGCGAVGQSDNKRTCPVLHGTMLEDEDDEEIGLS